MQIELIISTYNSPAFLQLALLSAAVQDVLPSSICIADDGSGPDTAAAIESFKAQHAKLSIRHVWQEDMGFEKNQILNKAIETSTADYLIFVDGDCLLHPCFIARHAEMAKSNRFLCGSLLRLDSSATQSISVEEITSGSVFSSKWLRDNRAFNKHLGILKARLWPKSVLSFLEIIWPIRRSWGGANASAFRQAILAINGFDETMKYYGEDKEFGVRLKNSGVAGRLVRFTAPLVHMDHVRGYVDTAEIMKNRQMIKNARKTGKIWAENGIASGDPN